MSTGPAQDPGNEIAPDRRRHRQVRDECRRFVECEVGQLDAVADVEWRPRGILDQIGGCGDADEHEGQTLEIGVRRPALIQETDRGKEVISEIEPQRGVDLVDEEHQIASGTPPVRPREDTA